MRRKSPVGKLAGGATCVTGKVFLTGQVQVIGPADPIKGPASLRLPRIGADESGLSGDPSCAQSILGLWQDAAGESALNRPGRMHGNQPANKRRSSPAVGRAIKPIRITKNFNRLVERYMPLVKYNGERVWSRLPEGIELDDLISAGVFGLIDAIDAFDLGRGVKFETYCVPRIRGAMLDELRSMDWVPRPVRLKASKIGEATKTLEARLGRHPSEKELAEHMGLSLAELAKFLIDGNAVNLTSLNKKWSETGQLQGSQRN